MHSKLLKPFTKEEVEVALNQMVHLKSPRPKGFDVVFYQKYWKTICKEVSDSVLSILNNEGMSRSLNSIFIALISKKCNAESMCDFPPIYLYNVIYKLVLKFITSKLKPIMHSLISSDQSAFILERLNTDNIMVVHEFLHTLKGHKRGRVGHTTVKLDML